MNLWEKLKPAEVELAATSDGLWPREATAVAVSRSEQLRLLRYTLGVDGELQPLAHLPPIAYKLASDVTREKPISGKTLGKSWELRLERDEAQGYVARLVAELKHRSLVPATVHLDGWADELREQVVGDSTDLLAGQHTVATLGDDASRSLFATACTRMSYAGYLGDQLSADSPSTYTDWLQMPATKRDTS